MALTEARIRSEIDRAGPGVEVKLYDLKVRGLVLWRRPPGVPRWYVIKRAGGSVRRMAVGSPSAWPALPLEAARTVAHALVTDLATGGDPVAAKRNRRALARGGRVPFADALARHLAIIRQRGRCGPHVIEVQRICEAAIAAGLLDLADPRIAAKAADWLETMDISDQSRRRYRSHLIAVGKTAVRYWPADVLPRDPFLALMGQKAPMPTPPFFQPFECAALVSDAALARGPHDGGRLWAFLLYAGCRFKEATWSRWDRIDLGRSTMSIIPPNAEEHAAGARVKRMKARTVTLQPELVALLAMWPRHADGFLFRPPWRTWAHSAHIRAFRAHLAALGIPLDGRRIHALRHSHACLAIAAGEDSLRLRLSMGHAGVEMAAHYAGQAMRWRGLLADWDGVFRLRDPAEVVRLGGSGSAGAAAPSSLRID